MALLPCATPISQTQLLLNALGKIIAKLPNKINITGHTDSKPYANQAGYSNQPSNSIVINASSSELSPSNSGLYINPIRNVPHAGLFGLSYNSSTQEISFDNLKTFIINHPVNPNKYLVHACLEGPEAGIYYRGKGTIVNNYSVKIDLPDYVKYIGTNYTINLTRIYSGQKSNEQYETSEIENNSFTVYGPNGSFYWIVYAERQKINVEPYKMVASNFTPGGTILFRPHAMENWEKLINLIRNVVKIHLALFCDSQIKQKIFQYLSAKSHS